MANNPYQKYQNTQVETSNQEKLVLMLYNGALKFVKQAKQGLKNNDYQVTNNCLIRTQNIINELMITLDMEQGGEIAQNLESLYDYMNRRLIEANINKSIEPMDEVINMLEELSDTWKQAMQNLKKERKVQKKQQVPSGGISVEG
ncbi:flagellar export chaperone FliS [Selenihalanaerobacter shriftii]|uniref:Flagellar secretion chaperone FliS n=1 Tax=Selenihalanaerobacter shriftii TaxID=142842 RepID=A0A1T4KNV0_9FIRM|nr:flagellar export chaperone FliS [Selenihalanaerobacter shriftii]SJZ44063.1 flagellar protein FliS [Selenihalanaerobacter shriftii]